MVFIRGFRFHLSIEHGIAWLFNFQLKMPWNKPLFSERYGYKKPLFNFMGYRVFYVPRPTQQSIKE